MKFLFSRREANELVPFLLVENGLLTRRPDKTLIFPDASDALISALPSGGIAAETKRLFLCRHGETELNRLGKLQGRRANPPLNAAGAAQAQLLARTLAGVARIDIVASSELRRASETADAVMALQPHAVRLVLPGLDEIDFGPAADGAPLDAARRPSCS